MMLISEVFQGLLIPRLSLDSVETVPEQSTIRIILPSISFLLAYDCLARQPSATAALSRR
jgi:hypothetical protein